MSDNDRVEEKRVTNESTTPEKEKPVVTHEENASSPSLEDQLSGEAKLSHKFENPLAGLSKEQLLADVHKFVSERDLEEHRELFEIGAQVAQRPDELDEIEGLTDEDKAIIEDEHIHRWKHPISMYLSIMLLSIGACVQGWDQTGSNGANLSFPLEFGIDNSDPTNPDYQRNTWLVGLVNSGPYFSASVLACWIADPLNELFGRRGALFIASVFCLISPIGSALTHTWYQLLVTRLLLGLGVGIKEVTGPVYAAENAPAVIRGALVMMWQLNTALGIFLGNTANLILHKVGPIAWRLQFGSALLPAIPLIALVYFCPESPRWYMKKNKYHSAFNSLKRLRRSQLLAARDMYYIHVQLMIEEKVSSHKNMLQRFKELFTVPRTRRATLAAFTVMIAQQMCGINIIAFFSSSIFSRATDSLTVPLLASFGFGLVNFVFAFPAIWTIDTFGRRTLLLFTFPQMTWSLLACGLSFLIPEDNSARLGVIAFFVYVFAAWYSPGEGPVPFTYSAEVFNLSVREIGMAFAVSVNNMFAGILSLTFFRIEAAFTDVGAFGFYAGLNAVAFFMILFTVPETKALTLEELDHVFSVPTKKFMSYQVRVAVPYWYRRWILWDRKATKEPLYNFEHIAASKNYS